MKKPTRMQQIFLYTAPFLGLATFKVWAGRGSASPESLLLVATAVLTYCIFVIFMASRWDRPTYFDWAVASYFAVVTPVLALWPEAAGALLARYSVTGIYICLFAAAFFPPVLGLDPFTYHYARKLAPQEVWGNPVFVKINRIMTYVWAGLFAVCIAISLYPSLVTRAFIPLSLILGVGMPFNVWFPNRYLRRLGLPSLAEQKRMAAEGALKQSAPAPRGPRPTSAREAVFGMPGAFSPEAAGDLFAVIGFMVTGSEDFEAYLRIEDGACTLEERAPRKPDLLIRTPAEVWLAIARGEMEGSQAFMTRAYTAHGNLGILMRMGQIFGGERSPNLKPAAPAQRTEATADEPQETRLRTPGTHQPAVPIHPADPGEAANEEYVKVLAIDSSPRGEGQSKTKMILNPFLEGMREAGARVERVDLRKKTVRNCVGCFTCWTKTPGVCVHMDDMSKELFPKWLEADIAVYATPLYHFTMNAAMKAFVERTLPVLEPFFVQEGGRTRHPLRHKVPQAVVMSVAGFPEVSVFDQLSAYVRFLFQGRLLAEIYRPGAEHLGNAPLREKREQILSALHQAGREMVQSRKVSAETLERITQPLGIEKEFAVIGDLMWKTCIAEGITPKELAERGMIPRPDSIDAFMIIMPMGFRADRAGDLRATMQFNFSGEVEGACHFLIENGKIQALAGSADRPDLTIETPFEIWMDIVAGKRDGQQMLMEQKYKASGDFSLLMRMGQIFGS